MKTQNTITGRVCNIETCRDGSMMVEIGKSWYNIDKDVSTEELRFCELWEVAEDILGINSMASAGFPVIKPA